MAVKHIFGGLLVLMGLGCSSQVGVAGSPLAVGDAAPGFDLLETSGKQASLKDLVKKGPVFLYFVKGTCSSNPSAVPAFSQLAKAYAGKAQFYAVIDEDAENAKRWKTGYSAPFPVLLDPEKKVIGAYGVSSSQTSFQIGADGKVAAIYLGWGQDSLKPLNVAMAKVAAAPLAKVDLSEIPSGTTYG